MIPDGLLIGSGELAPFGPVASLADRCDTLLAQQRASWDLLRRGYESLASVRTRAFSFDGFRFIAQFNAGRIISSSARVDEKSIRERKCFLCPAHLPPGQRGFLYGDNFLVLGNPFPIFPQHLTVPHIEHLPQRILPVLPTLLAMTRELAHRYTVVYNGPRCGASAPDHLHLQVGTGSFIPFEEEFASLPGDRRMLLRESTRLRAFSLEKYLRTVIVLEAADEKVMEEAFIRLYDAYQTLVDEPDEPLMNLVSFWRGGKFVLGVFGRSKHRPSRYFAEGEARMLLSPAAVDVGGVVTLPIERDLERMSSALLADVFGEVSLGADRFGALRDLLRMALADL